MDRVSQDTQQLIENLRNAVAEARRTREQTRRLLKSAGVDLEAQPEQTSQNDQQPRLRLHRVARW